MKVLIAVNEFKGSLTSLEIGEIISDKLKSNYDYISSIVQPIADGGDGFLSIFKGFNKEKFTTINAVHEECGVNYLINLEKKEAVIEVAEVIGLKYLTEEQKNPHITTTVGLGKLISFLLDKGIEHFIIGLGGSATNDCGIGMLNELGIKFSDEYGATCKHGINDLKKISNINTAGINGKLKNSRFTIISDVNNPLIGPNGSTYVFSKQKGLKEIEFQEVDSYIERFANLVNMKTNMNNTLKEGSGAAGGLGFSFMTFCNATIQSGSQFMINYLGLEEIIQKMDIIVTGEGKLDRQSYMGKAPIEIAKIAKRFNKKVIFLAGSILDDELEDLTDEDKKLIDVSFSIQRQFTSLNTAMTKEVSKANIENTIIQIFNLLEFYNE
ncbi:glycerate kinase [uncultured Gemella sp.]|uniref:glycerate kinase n=1 Tax=uncultured Gemella sp. TaxID=254352 RepID=UPI0025D0963B|nr:glycerate kinase [uncultured Gemella sp.]